MHARRTLSIAAGAALAAAALTCGSSWIALGLGASSYPVTGAGGAANVVVRGDVAYATRAERGIEVIPLAGGRSTNVAAPDSVDDLAVADGLLFALDARPPGHLAVFSLADPLRPRLVAPPVPVAVGPFSGVSAGGGRVVVSGGTSRMSLRTYDGTEIATADFGRGQPDVLLDGDRAFVSTHFWGPYFGLTTVRVPSLAEAGRLELETYGFTRGGAKPASFPLETALDGDTLLIADRDGLHLVDVRDFAKPREVATIDVGVEAVNVDMRDRVAAVVGSSPEPRLVLVDVAARRVLRSIALPEHSRPTGVAIGASRVVVATQEHGVLLIERRNS